MRFRVPSRRALSHRLHRLGRLVLLLVLAAAAPATQAASPPTTGWSPTSPAFGASVWAVDPLTVVDDDFARNRDPALWQGLMVQSIYFAENGVPWHLWHIVNRTRAGPLWVVPHDNENATFSAALVAVRSWGGTVMVVDTGPTDTGYGARFNGGPGRAIDPNRNFRDELPLYYGTILRDLGAAPQLIVALHTNAPGYDARLATCPGQAPAYPSPYQGYTGYYTGSGDISIRLCNDRFQPSPSQRRAWPFDDDDSLALTPYLANSDPHTAWCSDMLQRQDFNLVRERVAWTDGSLSNFAVLHGLRYINVETRDRGSGANGIADARDRLLRMIDTVMRGCGAPPAPVYPMPKRPLH